MGVTHSQFDLVDVVEGIFDIGNAICLPSWLRLGLGGWAARDSAVAGGAETLGGDVEKGKGDRVSLCDTISTVCKVHRYNTLEELGHKEDRFRRRKSQLFSVGIC